MDFSQDYELQLFDRIEKIKQINEEYNLEENSYIAFSGGKDSTVLHHLIDLALPNNKIPRVYSNTGLEYQLMVKFVKELQEKDNRIIILNPTKNIRKTLNEVGYPFKSKEHSQYVAQYQRSGLGSKTVQRYLNPSKERENFGCPKILRYQFTEDFNLKISDKCCYYFKKLPSLEWSENNNRPIVITGLRQEEGGNRANINCIVTQKDELKKFHPLAPLDNEFIKWFIQKYNIKLCDLYYEPYNFERTGWTN